MIRRKDETVVLKLYLPSIQRQALQLASFLDQRKQRRLIQAGKRDFL